MSIAAEITLELLTEWAMKLRDRKCAMETGSEI